MRLKLTLDEVTPIEYICQPEVERFVSYVLENFQPNGKNILVILPCSAKKPYANSKTQRKYIQTIKEAAGNKYYLIQEATLSGVLGIVPREIENLEIVLNYDFSLNRSKSTQGFHHQIIEILASRTSAFLRRYGYNYTTVISYGRERYLKVMERAKQMGFPSIMILPRLHSRLMSEGLTELATTLKVVLGNL
jgi:archaeosine synthase